MLNLLTSNLRERRSATSELACTGQVCHFRIAYPKGSCAVLSPQAAIGRTAVHCPCQTAVGEAGACTVQPGPGGLNETHVDHHRSGRCRSQLCVVSDAAWPAEIDSCPRRLRSDPRRRWHRSALPSSVGGAWASLANATRPTAGQRLAAVLPR